MFCFCLILQNDIQSYIMETVGCLGPWEGELDNSSCKTGQVEILNALSSRDKTTPEQDLSLLEEAHKKLGLLSLKEIGRETGCHRPCLYRTYQQFQEISERNFSPGDQTTLSIILSRSEVTSRRENFVYPLISFISEVGGAMGLFLGFSFLSLWDLSQFLVCLAYKQSLSQNNENL